MAAELQGVKYLAGKRKINEERFVLWKNGANKRAKRQFDEELNYEGELAQAGALASILLSRNPRKDRSCDKHRSNSWLKAIEPGMMRPSRSV